MRHNPLITTAMIKNLLLSCIRVCLEILRIAIIKALLPRLPPLNWKKEAIPVVRVDAGRVGICKPWERASTRNRPGRSLGDYFESKNNDKTATRSKILKYYHTKHAVPVDKANFVTPTKPAVVEFKFSICDPAPYDTRYLLTPLRPSIKEVDFTLLKNASERVSEILRENRRRLDAGEDPSTVRKEARRKRAMELSAVRKGQAKLSY